MSHEARTLAEVVGENLKDIRRAAGLSQDALATLMQDLGFGWHRQTVGQVEAGERPCTIEEILVLPAIFDLPARAFLVSPSTLRSDTPVRIGAALVSLADLEDLVTAQRFPTEPADKRARRAIDALVGTVRRPWSATWRRAGGHPAPSFGSAREAVLAERGRLPGPIYLYEEAGDLEQATVLAPWAQSHRMRLVSGVPYLPRDEGEAERLAELERAGTVRRISRQEAYRLRQKQKGANK